MAIMEAFLNSFFLVFASEMGDKTQLLTLLLTARYKKPWAIMSGILIATLLNHGLASWVGAFVAVFLSPLMLKWILAALFFIFGLWILIPDKEEEPKSTGYFGAFMATLVAFFLAEMGDKTQLATIALGARYSTMIMVVTIGTTVGMMASNALAVFLGDKLLQRVPMRWVRVSACMLFIVFGFGILLGF